jgi:hypothetical protein
VLDAAALQHKTDKPAMLTADRPSSAAEGTTLNTTLFYYFKTENL